MKPNSISGITYQVEDLARTADFYEALGFRRGQEEAERVTYYVNWFFVTFVNGGRQLPEKGAGISLYVKVDDVDEFHDGVIAKGMKPATEPQRQPDGKREFVLPDPDGYQLVFFEKK